MDVERWDIPASLRTRMGEVAREFRKAPTPSERQLWAALRGRKLQGCKFRRQQPIGPFVVDFFCAAERLIVEVDGRIHTTQVDADRERQLLLETLGLRFVRVPADAVENDLSGVLERIAQAIADHTDSPSPRLGEGVGG